MKLPEDVEVVFHFYEKRKLYEGYRPIHKVLDNYLTTGRHHYNDTSEETNEVEGTITFISPDAYPRSLWVGKNIDMSDGEKSIGYATVVKILNPILEAEREE